MGKKYKKAEWSISDDNNLIVENNTFSDLVDLCKPKLYSNDKIINFDAEREYETDGNYKLIYNNVKSMYFSMKKVVELKMQYEKNNNIEYDFVLHSRFDNNIISLPKDYIKQMGKYMNAEEILSFNMYDEGYINKSIKNKELKTSVITR